MFPSKKHETMSVPPDIEARSIFFNFFINKIKTSSDKGEPVEQIVLRFLIYIFLFKILDLLVDLCI